MESWGIIAAVAALLLVMTRVYGSIIDRLEKRVAEQEKENGSLRSWNNAQQQQINNVNDKTNAIWDFQMRRAQVVTVQQEKDMPLLSQCESLGTGRIPPLVREALTPIGNQLKRLYNEAKKLMQPTELDEGEVCLQIEKEFGNWLVEHLCIPFNQTHGECLIYALRLAKE